MKVRLYIGTEIKYTNYLTRTFILIENIWLFRCSKKSRFFPQIPWTERTIAFQLSYFYIWIKSNIQFTLVKYIHISFFYIEANFSLSNSTFQSEFIEKKKTKNQIIGTFWLFRIKIWSNKQCTIDTYKWIISFNRAKTKYASNISFISQNRNKLRTHGQLLLSNTFYWNMSW